MAYLILEDGEEIREDPLFKGYWVTNNGRVFSNRPINGKGALTDKFRELKPKLCSKGRYLCYGPHKRIRMIHRAVAHAFLGDPPFGTEVSHKDGNSHNNRADNLEYVTHAQNERMKYLHGTKGYGDLSPSHKLSQEQVDEIRNRLKNYRRGMLTAIAKEYGLNIATIHQIYKGKTWKQFGSN